VWVEFEAGDPSSPVFVGAFWSGDGEPPAPANADGEGVMHRNGIERGIVTDVEDPVRKGRLQIELPLGSGLKQWAHVMRPFGTTEAAQPQPGDELVVAFEHGDARFPVILGGLWKREDEPPSHR
jgi:uncharacterized protein involved in type VI secretion and phage assembly